MKNSRTRRKSLLLLLSSTLSGGCYPEPYESRGIVWTKAPEGTTVDNQESLSFFEYHNRRATVADAKMSLSRLFDAADSAGDGEDGICDFAPSGKTNTVPPLSANCYLGPNHRCVAVDPPLEPTNPWEYSSELWLSVVWQHLKFGQDEDYYHFTLEWETNEDLARQDPYWRCQIKATAIGDIDGDGIQSRFERRKTIDGLIMVNEFE